jgi:hypothetical protein
MTSLTTILGLLPLALGIGAGSELQAPLALTVMGGLTSATFLTLVFIPALYLIVAGFFEKKRTGGPAPAIITTAPKIIPEPKAIIEVQPQPEVLPPAPGLPTPKEPPTPLSAEKTKPAKIEASELNIRQKELLEKLKSLKKITRKDYAAMFGISVPTAARDLKELVDQKLVRTKGPFGPGRWYELTESEDEPA